MSLLIRPVTTVDKTHWNQYVHTHPEATAYHNFAWVESVEQAYKHPNTSLIAFNNDKVVGVLPVIKMQIPFSGNFLCSLPYCDLGHALTDNKHVTDALLETLNSLKLSNNSKKIEYRDNASSTPVSPATITDELHGKKVRMLLSLPDTSEKLIKGFKSKLRSQIKKSEKNGLTYKVGNNPELLDAFYQVLIINMRKLGSPVHSKFWYETLRKNYQDNLLISVVYTENIPIGAGIVLRNGNKACIPWASTLSEYNRLSPNMLLYWSLLKKVTDSGAEEFDFGRSTYGEGTFKFKQQWGAQPRALHWFLPGEQPPLSEEPNTPSNLRNLIEQTWSKFPISVTTFIGPKIRKYISL